MPSVIGGRPSHPIYFEAPIEFNQYLNLKDFLRQASEIVDLYLL